MEFNLSEEQLLIQRQANEFAKDILAPVAAEIDEKAQIPPTIVAQCANLGLLGMTVPEELGGSGYNLFAHILALEEIASGCASTALYLSVINTLVCEPLLRYGSEGLKREFLPDLCSGKRKACFALSEPEAGSDVAALTTRVEDKGSYYSLTGLKSFITLGPEADYALVFATHDPQSKHKGISAFLIPLDSVGVERSNVDAKLGLAGAPTCQLTFENVKISKNFLLGKEREGFQMAMRTLDCGRIAIAAQSVGIARAAFHAATQYSKERHTFGKPISSHQAIQIMVADMATEINASRLLTWKAANAYDKEQPISRLASVAKLFASETANRVARQAMQILGGYGFFRGTVVERTFRDAKATEIYEGTSEIQRLIIAADYLRS